MKNIIVTGAGQGIGYQLALALAVQAGHCVLATSRNRTRLEKLVQESESRKNPGKIIFLPFDLEKGSLEEEFLPFVRKELGRVDILVNNAAHFIRKDFDRVTREDWEKTFRVNIFSPALLINELLPLMGGQASSHIVNISSMGGFQGSVKFTGLGVYSASKAALVNLTESLAVELSPRNIRVNCLALGAVETEMLRSAFPDYKAPVSAQTMAKYIAGFALEGGELFNGKVLPVAVSTP